MRLDKVFLNAGTRPGTETYRPSYQVLNDENGYPYRFTVKFITKDIDEVAWHAHSGVKIEKGAAECTSHLLSIF